MELNLKKTLDFAISVELLSEERKNAHGGKNLRIGLKTLLSEWKSGGKSYGIDSEDTMKSF